VSAAEPKERQTRNILEDAVDFAVCVKDHWLAKPCQLQNLSKEKQGGTKKEVNTKQSPKSTTAGRRD